MKFGNVGAVNVCFRLASIRHVCVGRDKDVATIRELLKNLTARCQLVLFSSLKGKPLKRAMVADDQKRFVKKVVTERFYGKDHCEGFFFYGSVI
ncbi:hypothetical protein OUZ56_025566 [Daphnia magna]|uniref:Uncharacterized protein n=1 Tax=Daphnia magna TaxID=35525 RepID=A0ABQ9ZK93_9CRUS|nr:hypothetical protein OUZ56_025566 [Daphnia magna]